MSGKDLKKWLKANRVAREATMSADEIADTRKAWKALEKARGGSALSQFRAAQIVRGGRLAQAGRGAKSLLRKVGKHPPLSSASSVPRWVSVFMMPSREWITMILLADHTAKAELPAGGLIGGIDMDPQRNEAEIGQML